MFGSTEKRGDFLFQEWLQLGLNLFSCSLLQRGVLHFPWLDDRIAGSPAHGGAMVELNRNATPPLSDFHT